MREIVLIMTPTEYQIYNVKNDPKWDGGERFLYLHKRFSKVDNISDHLAFNRFLVFGIVAANEISLVCPKLMTTDTLSIIDYAHTMHIKINVYQYDAIVYDKLWNLDPKNIRYFERGIIENTIENA